MEPNTLNLLGGYGSWAEETTRQPGRLSFAPVMKSGKIRLAEWKKQGRAVVRELLGPSPVGPSSGARPALKVQSTAKRVFDGLVAERLVDLEAGRLGLQVDEASLAKAVACRMRAGSVSCARRSRARLRSRWP